jgi:hypothetical protein
VSKEEREVQRLVIATSERLDGVRQAKAFLAVAAGQPFLQDAHEAGLKSGDGVGKLGKRFNEHGLAALSFAGVAAAKPHIRARSRRASWPRCSELRIAKRN